MNQPTPVLYDNEARKKILAGVDKIYQAVRRTMGPQGGNALIYGLYSRPYRITNDGYTVADIIELKDTHEKLAAEAIVDAAKRTNMLAGDATSATTVISSKGVLDILPILMKESETSNVSKSFTVNGDSKKRGLMTIRRELFTTQDVVVAKLKAMSKTVETLEELERIAISSVEDEELGKTIAAMAWKVQASGYIATVEGFNNKIETELIEGARFPAKIPAKVFINVPEKYEMEVENTPILLTNYTIDAVMMQRFLKNLEGLPKLTIIAPQFKDDALVMMANVNKEQNAYVFIPVKVPSLQTVQFEDLQVYCGARFINKDQGDLPEHTEEVHLGFLSKLTVKDADTREDAIALGGKGAQKREAGDVSPVQDRIEMLQEQLKNTPEEGRQQLLRRRIAGLGSAIGVIRVSRASEGETYYWKKKVEDAVLACRSALEEGYLPGGGLALKGIAEELEEDNLLRSALLQPYLQIQENAGGVEIPDTVIDATKAIRCAVEHSVSVIAGLVAVRVLIPYERETTDAEATQNVAHALLSGVLYWAKERGIIDENDAEIMKDTMAHHDAILRKTVD